MKTNQLIWILEDDKGSQFVYDEILSVRYKLRFFDTVDSFKSACERVQGDEKLLPNLVIADLKLPDQNFLTYIANAKSDLLARVKFIVVSSMDDLDISRECFKVGALDYITKPFGKSELVVKVERLLDFQVRQEKDQQAVSKSVSGVSVDLGSMLIRNPAGVEAQLTLKEMQIFNRLNREKNQALQRKQIIQEVWRGVKVGTKTLDVHIFNLRRKLEKFDLSISFDPPDRFRLFTKES